MEEIKGPAFFLQLPNPFSSPGPAPPHAVAVDLGEWDTTAHGVCI